MKRFINNTVRLFGSLKLSFVLLVFLVMLIAERAIIAQRAVFPADEGDAPWFIRLINAMGVDSPQSLNIPFLAVLIVFVLNLGFASVRMVRAIRGRHKGLSRFKDETAIRTLTNHTVLRTTADAEPVLAAFFRKHGFREHRRNTGPEYQIYAGKRLNGRWGVFFFHLTFLVVLAGAVLSLLTRYAGYVELIPGEVFVEKRDSYLNVTERPMLFGSDREFRLQLDAIDLSYWKPGEVRERASIVSVFDSNGKLKDRRRIEVNRPLSIDSMTVYQGSRHGYVAGLEAKDSRGTKAAGKAHFRLPEDEDLGMTTRVHLPGTNLTLELELFTDKIGEIEGLEDLALHHQATLLKVYSRQGSSRRFHGVVFGGGSLSFERLTLNFVSLAPYTSYVMVRDYGVPVIFAGFLFLLLGLLITYFWVPEMYWVSIRQAEGKEQVVIGAVTEKYKESFRERFMANMADLKKEMVC